LLSVCVFAQADKLTLALDVLCASWNAGNTEPVTLDPWIPAGGGDFDVIAVAAQECKITSKWKGESAAAGEEEEEEEEEEGADAADGEDGKAALTRLRTALRKEPSATGSYGGGLSHRDLGATPVRTASAETEAEALAGVASEWDREDVIPDQEALKHAIAAQSPFYKMVVDHIGDDFDIVALSLMFQTGILVAVRKRLSKRVSAVYKAQEATGVLRMGTNKGGVLVQVEIAKTRLCFVGAHLAAHLQHCGKRDQDILEIVGQIRIGTGLKDVDLDAQAHHVFWMGDLNYRVDWDKLRASNHESMGEAEAAADSAASGAGEDGKTEHAARFSKTTDLIAAKEWASLYQADQLRLQMDRGYVLHGFSEVEPDFAPTFKVLKSATLGYKSKRIPSYCDRILWKSIPGLADKISAGPFRAFPEIPTSDHKPVSCEFKVKCMPVASLKDVESPAAAAGAGAAAIAGAGSASSSPPLAAAPSTVESAHYILRFHGLRGSDLVPMDWGGVSDPYIRFFSDPERLIVPRADGRQPRSTHVPKTLSPAWEDTDVPDLVLTADSIDDLARCHIFLALGDHDDIDADDGMGQAVLSLEPAVQAALASDGGVGARLYSAINSAAKGSPAKASKPGRVPFCLPVTQATSNICPVVKGARPTITGEVEIIMPGTSVHMREGGKDGFKCCCNCDACCTVM
jgi:endonuclease/exonuclease/phosphatase family metal-dependent hydrolase